MMIAQGVVVDNVSLLPVAPEWIVLALACLGFVSPIPIAANLEDEVRHGPYSCNPYGKSLLQL